MFFAVAITLGVLSSPIQTNAIGLTPFPVPVERLDLCSQQQSQVKFARVIITKSDYISFQSAKEIVLLTHLANLQISSNPEIVKMVKNLRGGNLTVALAIGVLGVIILMFAVEGAFLPGSAFWGQPLAENRPNPFQPPSAPHKFPPYYEFFSPPKRPSSTLEINRPNAMPHAQFGGLTKEARRALPHKNDMQILTEGRPALTVGF